MWYLEVSMKFIYTPKYASLEPVLCRWRTEVLFKRDEATTLKSNRMGQVYCRICRDSSLNSKAHKACRAMQGTATLIRQPMQPVTPCQVVSKGVQHQSSKQKEKYYREPTKAVAGSPYPPKRQ